MMEFKLSRQICLWFSCVAAMLLASGGLTVGMAQNTTPLPQTFFAATVQSFDRAFPLQGGMVLGTLGKVPGITWKYIEPTQDCGPDPNTTCYQWGSSTSGLLGWVTFGQANGLTLAYDFSSMPGWLCTQQNSDGECMALPSNLTAVSNFATALATKFKGQIKYYETYNEVDDSLSEWSDTCSNLVLFHNTIYNAVKSVDAAAVVGAPNMAIQSTSEGGCAQSPTPSGNPSDPSIWIQNFLQTRDSKNDLPKVDTIGVHTYGAFSYSGCTAASSPNCYTPSGYGCDYRVDKLHCAGQPLLNIYSAFRAVMNNNGLAGRPLLVTEGGFGADASPSQWCPSSSPYLNTACLSPTQQDAYVGRWLVLSASTSSDGSGQLPSWYSYDIDWGTLNGSSNMNPQNSSAYGQMETWLQGALFQQPCHSATPTTVLVCDFVNGNGNQSEIIFNDNNGATATYTTPAWAGFYQTLLGNTLTISNESVTVGDMPTLLTPEFSFSISPASQSIAAGQPATYTLSLTSLSGFSQSVSLACSVVPAATCSLSPTSISGDGHSTVTVLTGTAMASSYGKQMSVRVHDDRLAWISSFFGMCLLSSKTRRRRLAGILVAVVLSVILMAAGCGGGASMGSAPGNPATPTTYTITIAGTSGNTQHSITATLVVQ